MQYQRLSSPQLLIEYATQDVVGDSRETLGSEVYRAAVAIGDSTKQMLGIQGRSGKIRVRGVPGEKYFTPSKICGDFGKVA